MHCIQHSTPAVPSEAVQVVLDINCAFGPQAAGSDAACSNWEEEEEDNARFISARYLAYVVIGSLLPIGDPAIVETGTKASDGGRYILPYQLREASACPWKDATSLCGTARNGLPSTGASHFAPASPTMKTRLSAASSEPKRSMPPSRVCRNRPAEACSSAPE